MTRNNAQGLPVIQSGVAASSQLTRRKMVQRLLAGAAWRFAATSHPVYELLRNRDAVFADAQQLGAANWKPIFLNSQQAELLTAIAESIVPESSRAYVNRFIDLLLSVDKTENRSKFVQSLAALDAEVQKRFEKSFPALHEEQKNAFLTDVSTKPEMPADSGKAAAQKKSSLYAHFENLKAWVRGAYYSSEVGMRELGWTGDYVYEKFPGCAHADGRH